MPKRRVGECVYCGMYAVLTDDHIPPKGLFGRENRQDLIRVPACKACNGGFARDDEYFRMMIALKDRRVIPPDATEATDAVIRSLGRREQSRLREATFRNLRPAERWSGGVFLGSALAYHVDLTRLSRVVERIVRGLFWHEFSARLAADYAVDVRAFDGLPKFDIKVGIHMNRMIRAALSGSVRSVGSGVFEYAYAKTKDGRASVWILRFYGDVAFLVFVLPQDLQQARTGSRVGGDGSG